MSEMDQIKDALVPALFAVGLLGLAAIVGAVLSRISKRGDDDRGPF